MYIYIYIYIYTVRSESRCALRLRYVDFVVSCQTLVDTTSNTFYKCTATFRTDCTYHVCVCIYICVCVCVISKAVSAWVCDYRNPSEHKDRCLEFWQYFRMIIKRDVPNIIILVPRKCGRVTANLCSSNL
jgi:hypothetical protein